MKFFQYAIRCITALLALCSLVVASPAQTVSKWIFARSLHVRLPADPSSGGVSWATGAVGLPTSWSAEGGGARVEIAEIYGGKTNGQLLELMQKALPGATSPQAYLISSYPAVVASAGNAKVLGIRTNSKTWIAVAKGDSNVVSEVLRSITIERDDPQNWQRRYMPGVGIRTFLPFHVAPDLSASNGPNIQSYELKWDGFSFSASCQKPDEGKRLDLKTSVDDDVKQMKAQKAYTDVKVQRVRIKEAKDAEIVIYDFKEKGQSRVQYFLVAKDNRNTNNAVMMRWTYDWDNRKHIDWSNRILFGFEQPQLDNRGQTVSWSGQGGFSLEVPKEPSQVKSGNGGVWEWTSELPLLMTTIRVTENSSRQAAPEKVGELLVPLFKGMQNAKDMTIQTVPYVVSGIDGVLVKAKFKLSGNNWNYRYGLVIQTAFYTYVLDILSSDEDSAAKIIESARIDMNIQNNAFPRKQLKNVGFSVLTTEALSIQEVAADANYEAMQLFQQIEGGKMVLNQVGQSAKAGVPAPKAIALQIHDQTAKALNGKAKLLNEGWAMDGEAYSYWTVYEINAAGKTYRGVSYITALGKDSLVQNVIYVDPAMEMRRSAHLFMNSYRYND